MGEGDRLWRERMLMYGVGAGGGGGWWTEKATAVQRKRESATRFDFHTHPTLAGPFPAELRAALLRWEREHGPIPCARAAQLPPSPATLPRARRHQLIRSDGFSAVFHA